MADVSSIFRAIKSYEPEHFLNVNDDVSSTSLEVLKNLYDFTKDTEATTTDLKHLAFSSISNSRSKKKRKLAAKAALTEAPLRNLITESFDSEQIWEEVQLQNGLMYENLVTSISKLIAQANSLQSQAAEIEAVKEVESNTKKQNNVPIPSDVEDDDSEYEFEGNPRKKQKTKKSKSKTKGYSKSIVDDKFFNLAQMTEFLEKVEIQMEAEETRGENEQGSESDSAESIDMFAALDDEDEDEDADGGDSKNVYYNDFFDKPLDEVESSTSVDNPHPAEDIQDQKRNSDAGMDEDDDDLELDDDDDDDLELNDEDDDNDEDMEGSKGAELRSLEPADGSSSSEDELELPKDPSSTSVTTQDPSKLSEFEKRRKKIDETIDQIEKEALQPKSWQFKGEVTGDKRPENSLLEEHLVFDHLLRQAPEITAKTTLKLEDIMKQRIKDQAWDDVERKAKPTETPVEYKNKLILDSEKSKQSLAQVYEQEYINQKKAEEGQNDVETVPEEEAQIQKDMKSLFAKLDALSNFHFTPKPTSSDIKIVTNLPSISMEEVAPISVSDATLLAPQEIQAPLLSSELKAKAERDSTDKSRDRRKKKKKQHLKRIDREERARVKGLGLRNVKLADNMLSSDKKTKKGDKKKGTTDASVGKSKELKSSKAFFDTLQDKVQTQIQQKLTKSTKSDTGKSRPQAKRFKL